MNIKNYQYLADSLEALGFGEAFNSSLKTKMELGFKEFELKAKTKFGSDQMNYNLKFSLGEQKGESEPYYALNTIKTTLTKENDQSTVQEFILFKSRGFNTKEMYNLVEKRPVYKEFKGKDGRWSKLDFTTTDDNGNAQLKNYYNNTTNFSLTREVGKLPLNFANPQEREDLLRDLQSGEKVSVTIRQNGKTEVAVIEVAPQLGGLILYNNNMEVIRRTNTHQVEIVPDEQLAKGNKAIQTPTEQGQFDKLPDSTKQLMNKINSPEKEGQGQKKKIS